ncbi:Anaphase-promoting complex subunit 1 [Savitreella phatthalungensis]
MTFSCNAAVNAAPAIHNTYSRSTQTEDDHLRVDGTTVFWHAHGRLVRKFDLSLERQRIVQATFAWFERDNGSTKSQSSIHTLFAGPTGYSPPQPPWTRSNAIKSTALKPFKPPLSSGSAGTLHSDVERALVILLEDIAHVYFEDGRRHVISLLFRVSKAFSTRTLGLILRRDNNELIGKRDAESASSPVLFNLTNPMREIGVVLPSQRDSHMLGPADDLLYAGDWSILTCNRNTKTVSLWRLSKPGSSISHSRTASSAARAAPPVSRRRPSTRYSSLASNTTDHPDESRRANLTRDSRAPSTAANEHSTFIDRIIFADSDASDLSPDAFRKEAVLDHVETFHVGDWSPDEPPKVSAIEHGLSQGKLELLILLTHAQQLLHVSLEFLRTKVTVQRVTRSVAAAAAVLASPIGPQLCVLAPDGRVSLRLPGNIESTLLLARAVLDLTGEADILRVRFRSLDGKALVSIPWPRDELVINILDELKHVLSPPHHSTLIAAYLETRRIRPEATELDVLLTAYLAGFCLPGRDVALTDYDPHVDLTILQLARQAHALASVCDLSILREICPQLLFALLFICEDLQLNKSTADRARSLCLALAQVAEWFGWDKYVDHFLLPLGSDAQVALDDPLSHISFTQPQDAPPCVVSWLIDALDSEAKVTLQSYDSIFGTTQTSRRTGIGKGHAGASTIPVFCRRTARIVQLYRYLLDGDLATLARTVADSDELQRVISDLPLCLALPLKDAMLFAVTNVDIPLDEKLLRLVGRADVSHPDLGKKSAPVTPNAEVPTIAELSRTGDDALTEQHETTDQRERELIRLLYPVDQRVNEARKMLQCHQPQAVKCDLDSDIGDEKLLRAQQTTARLANRRCLATPAGRALFTFSSRLPLPTERFEIPTLDYDVKLLPAAVTVAEDKTYLTPELKCWGNFHNGVMAGLSISRSSQDMSASWVAFNKPESLDETHAGFLLGIGLNGHLRTMATWHAFNYLTSKHIMTSVGLLLGLAASFRGTTDQMVTRLLSVHVLAVLPPGSLSLNLTCETQTAGVVGIGLLYAGTSHGRMSEVMLREICDNDTSAPDLFRTESYRLGAGLALGMINIAQGHSMTSLNDVALVDRLNACIRGLDREKHDLDQKIPGAIVALGLIFMKSNSTDVARRLAPPNSILQLERLRPSIWLIAMLCLNLILWDAIEPDAKFVERCLPPCLFSVHSDRPRRLDTDDAIRHALVTGATMSIGLRFAGSSNESARDAILTELDYMLELAALPNTASFDDRAARYFIKSCAANMCVAAACVMAGTGDIPVLRRVRRCHYRLENDSTYGIYTATQQATGLLFLAATAGRPHSLDTSDPLAIAALLAAFYPILPNAPTDNSVHLQALRHLWALAAQPRTLVTVDSETGAPTSCDITVTLRSGEVKQFRSPCLLPPIDELLHLTATSKRHYPVDVDLHPTTTASPPATLLRTKLQVLLKQKQEPLDPLERILGKHALDIVDDASDLDDAIAGDIGVMLGDGGGWGGGLLERFGDLVTMDALTSSLSRSLKQDDHVTNLRFLCARIQKRPSSSPHEILQLKALVAYWRSTRFGNLAPIFATPTQQDEKASKEIERTRVLETKVMTAIDLMLWHLGRLPV